MGRLSLGSGTFGREIDEETSWQLLDHAMEQGINLLDTAEAYGGAIRRPAASRPTASTMYVK